MKRASKPVDVASKTSKRAQLIEIFSRAAETAFEGHEAEWTWLLTSELSLPLCYSTAVYEVLKQGRWKDAENPKAYIKTAARREALKAGDGLSKEFALVSSKSAKSAIDDYDKSGGGVTAHKIGGKRIYDVCDREVPTDSEGRELAIFNGKAVAEYLCSPEDDEPDARWKIDFQKVYAEAGADEHEQRILTLRSNGFTAQEIYDSAPSDREKQELQNAYRRVDGPLKSRIAKLLEGTE